MVYREGILDRDDVDPYRTIPNNFHTIYRFLGTEAVRMYHIIELSEAIADTYHSHRHVVLLSDVMTNRGGIFPANKLIGAGWLSKASKSSATGVIVSHATIGSTESVNKHSATVTGAVAAGTNIRGGTNMMELVIDHKTLNDAENKYNMEVYQEQKNNLKMTDDEVQDFIFGIIGREKTVDIIHHHHPAPNSAQVATMIIPEIEEQPIVPVVVKGEGIVAKKKWVAATENFIEAVEAVKAIPSFHNVSIKHTYPPIVVDQLPNLPPPKFMPVINILSPAIMGTYPKPNLDISLALKRQNLWD
jgi:hypothetical protein